MGLKNLKCAYCKKMVTRKNIGGILGKEKVMCRSVCCMIDYITEEQEKDRRMLLMEAKK
jgi:hypothetical protein